MPPVLRRFLSLTAVVSIVLSTVAVLVPQMAKPADAARKTKFTICHRTNAITNPYRRITVAWSSVNDDENGHDIHDGVVFKVADPVGSHGTLPRDFVVGGGNDRWGDIFNVSRTTGAMDDRQNSKNWTTEGEAIFNGATFRLPDSQNNLGPPRQACRLMTAQEHLASEIPALLEEESAKTSGQRTPAQVIAAAMTELDEMGAAEDVALKEGLKDANGNPYGSFANWYRSCTTNCTDITALTTTLNTVPQPSVTTTAPTNTAETTATLNGTITPLTKSMTWYFELSTSTDFSDSSRTVNDVPATPQGPSTAQGPVFTNVTDLTGGTTYYYRTVGITVTNDLESFYYGQVEQFTTPTPNNQNQATPPAVTTEPATSVTGITATINGTGTTNGADSNVKFTWGTRSDLTGGDTRVDVAASPSNLVDPVTNGSFSLNLTGLEPATKYYFRATITNANGTRNGETLDFTTLPRPAVTTEPATSVTGTTATINGTGTSNGAQSTVTFTWGTRSDLTGGDTQSGVAATPDPLAANASGAAVSAALTGLTPGTTYYFRATITNANTNVPISGIRREFTTDTPNNVNNSTPPEVTTEPATSVTGTTATINGTGTSNGAQSNVTFTWGTRSDLTGGDTQSGVAATPDPLASSASGTAVSADLTGLTPGTTYYFRATISNTNGTVNGIIREFTTPLATSASSDPLGRVIGTAWFDVNRNNVRDPGEPLLPGVDVRLTPTGVSGQSWGSVRKSNLVMKTTSDGSFDFSELAPGTYTITSVLPGEFGIQESWDSTGNNDWRVTVTVVARQTARGDFAAIGTAQATGSVDGGGGGTVDATWSGFDQTNQTNDDVTFTVKVAGSGNFSMDGLPTGKYTVKATSRTGRTLVSTNALRISSKGATLTLNGLTMNVAIVSMLPQTGATNMFLPFGFATMLIPAGVAVTAATRRRRRS